MNQEIEELNSIATQYQWDCLISNYSSADHEQFFSIAKLHNDNVLMYYEKNDVSIVIFDKNSKKISKYYSKQCDKLISDYEAVNQIELNVNEKSDFFLNLLCKLNKLTHISDLRKEGIGLTFIEIIDQTDKITLEYIKSYLSDD